MEVESIRVDMDKQDFTAFSLELYDSLRLARRIDTLDGINWSQENIDLFNNKMENLRLSCTRPWYAESLNLGKFNNVNQENRLITLCQKLLLESRPEQVEEPRCSICYDSYAADSITKCCHIFCYTCIYRIAISTGKCPTCRVKLHGFDDISRMSEKLGVVMFEVIRSVGVNQTDSRRVVVLSSCKGSLKLLRGGLVGFGRDPYIWDDDNMVPRDLLERFLNPPNYKNILLLHLKALKTDIILPSNSMVLIVDAVVTNVKNYIFQKIRTAGKDTLSKAMYISKNTIEELIAMEPDYEDGYDMMDADGNFTGQVFKRRDRSLALLETTQQLYVPIEDPGEDAEEVDIF